MEAGHTWQQRSTSLTSLSSRHCRPVNNNKPWWYFYTRFVKWEVVLMFSDTSAYTFTSVSLWVCRKCVWVSYNNTLASIIAKFLLRLKGPKRSTGRNSTFSSWTITPNSDWLKASVQRRRVHLPFLSWKQVPGSFSPFLYHTHSLRHLSQWCFCSVTTRITWQSVALSDTNDTTDQSENTGSVFHVLVSAPN